MTNSNLPKISPRAQKALDVLANGGRFVIRLERNSYTGREQFAYRLLDGARRVVKGVGLHAFHEIKGAFLVMCEGGCTSVTTAYRLRTE